MDHLDWRTTTVDTWSVRRSSAPALWRARWCGNLRMWETAGRTERWDRRSCRLCWSRRLEWIPGWQRTCSVVQSRGCTHKNTFIDIACSQLTGSNVQYYELKHSKCSETAMSNTNSMLKACIKYKLLLKISNAIWNEWDYKSICVCSNVLKKFSFPEFCRTVSLWWQ